MQMNIWRSLAMKSCAHLEDVIKVSSELLKQGGKVAFVHRPGRLMDIVTLMRKYRLEPKRLQICLS